MIIHEIENKVNCNSYFKGMVLSLDLIIAFSITFILLVSSVFKGIFLAYPLMAGILLFFLVGLKRGYSFLDILKMAYKGGTKSFIVIKVLLLIGAVISVWMSSGTVPAMIYYGIELIKPNGFILSAFLISCFVSFLIGTATGTAGVVGTALMSMAISGDVNLSATAGAIISGAYFGDRCSPMSSSASFVSFLTETNIYDNIKNMFKTSIIPLVISVIFYSVLSQVFPLNNSTNDINNQILKIFNVNLITLVPAFVIIIFSIFKINVKTSMIASIFIALIISIVVQHQTILNCVKFIIFGYSLDDSNSLSTIIRGGGIISLSKTSLIVFLASAFAGIIEDTKMLNSIEVITEKANSRYMIFKNVFITSIFASIIGCSQTVAVMLTHMLNKKSYVKNNLDNSFAAIDLENTAIMFSPLIPWNIALLAPIMILGADISCIPYLMYIYLLPIWYLLSLKFYKNRNFSYEARSN
jgi:Na+:H+ antiporter, NhaC family